MSNRSAEDKDAVYKLIKDTSPYFEHDHCEFLVSKIFMLNPSEMAIDEMNLLHDLTKTNKFKEVEKIK